MDNKVLKEIEKTLTKNSTSDRPDTQFIYLDNGFSYFTEASGRIAVRVKGELPFEVGDSNNEIGARLFNVFNQNDISSWEAYDLPDKKALLGIISDKRANDIDYDSKHNFATIEFGESMFKVDTLKVALKYVPTCNKILVRPDGKISALQSNDTVAFVFGTLPNSHRRRVDSWRASCQARRDSKLVSPPPTVVNEVQIGQDLEDFID